MKKLTTALLTALLLLNLAACGEKEPDDTSSGYDDSLISEPVSYTHLTLPTIRLV